MQAGGQPEALLLDSTHVKAQCCAAAGKGGHAQAIGRSRGGRTRKIHLAVDQFGRPDYAPDGTYLPGEACVIAIDGGQLFDMRRTPYGILRTLWCVEVVAPMIRFQLRSFQGRSAYRLP